VNTLNLLDAAHAAIAARPDRPATAIVLDDDAARLILFRLAPGQSVPLHRNASIVMLTVLQGTGTILGRRDDVTTERQCHHGDFFSFERGELHGMRADEEELVLLATIAPRSGTQ